MKNAKKLLFTLTAFLAVSGGVFAQNYLEDEKWGATREDRQQNVLTFNYLKDAYDMKDYARASQYVMELIEKAPKSHENIYVRGSNIYKTKINQSKSVAERNALVDTLMFIYDKRVEAFADTQEKKGSLLSQKAADYLVYRAMDRDNIQKYYNDAIDATGGKDATILNTYFSILIDDYKADLIETDAIMDEYDRLSKMMADANDAEEGQKILDNLFVQVADCENLERIYRTRYEADPNNVELMTKIVNMLGRAKCEGEFQLTVAENLYKVSPTPETGLALATIFEARSDYEKSLYYWQESINNEPDAQKKADYTMRAAAAAFASKNFRQAVTFARECLDIDPNNGLAYMIIGQSYAMTAGSSCSDNFAQRAVYWLVVDNLQKARSLLTGDTAQSEALTQQINSASANYPSNEECFFRSLNNGDAYTVNCGWISGRTTVRVGR